MGYIDKYGYKYICIDYWNLSAHQVAWAMHYGRYPEKAIDHINHDKQDNSIINLREVTCTENNRNKKITSKSGVSFRDRHKKRKYIARIRVDHKEIHIGSYETSEEAHEAYMQVKKRLHTNTKIAMKNYVDNFMHVKYLDIQH